jgi:hypothetical protein
MPAGIVTPSANDSRAGIFDLDGAVATRQIFVEAAPTSACSMRRFHRRRRSDAAQS